MKTQKLTPDVRWDHAASEWVLFCDEARDLVLKAGTISDMLELIGSTFATALNSHFAKLGSKWTYEVSVVANHTP